MTPRPISLCVITQNEADRIHDCLASVAGFCDDMVVVDGGSTDDTLDIARKAGARVMSRPFDGFRSQKAFAVSQAKNDWVLCLDADERVGADLRSAIEAAFDKGFDAAGYRFHRRNDFFGQFMRHGNAGADKVLRLFDRRRGGWRGPREIHESVSVDGEVRMLGGFLDHYPYRSLSELMAKQERYAHMMATEEFAAGKRATLAQIVLSPMWRFFRGYVLRAGFLDGWRGIVYALLRVEYVRRKYVKLWLLQQGQKP